MLYAMHVLIGCTVLGMSTTQRIGNTSDWYEIHLLTDLYKQENGLSYALMSLGC